jgi:hypothetical protein
MSEQVIKGKWKGVVTTPSISNLPTVGMVYSGVRNRGKQQSKVVVGILIEVYPDQNDAILRDKENFPHCVFLDSLKIIINDK